MIMRIAKCIHRWGTWAFHMLRPAMLIAILLSLLHHPARAATVEAADLFESKIRPLLADRCQKCHGGKKQESGLRLDSRNSALTGGDSGPAVVAGQPDESELVKRITDPDDDSRMPPPDAGKRLDAAQVETVKLWIKLGAPWPESAAP